MYQFLAIIYRYHKRNFNKDIPYFSTLLSILILLVINCSSILVLLDMKHIINFGENASKRTEYIVGLILIIPLISILAMIFPASEIKKKEKELSERKYKVGRFIFFTIYIISICLFLVII